ncbi:uncharacterized protein [Pyxicephalus adspersus]|uniref:uncharacterized protein n=1 Tax=Pyxicephalus adspersus TaxID=30357 RepID=UPI003B5C6FD8
MAIASAFGSYSASGSKILNAALLTFSVIGIEAILDSSFQCPSSKYSVVLACVYSLSFYLCPAIVFVFLGLHYFPGFNKKMCCPCWSGNWACIYVVMQIGQAPVIWLLIAMTDGQYLSCFVVVVSNYQLDHDFYLLVFQTTGMLTITLVIITWYYISKCTCLCMEDSRRTYQMLADVENILEEDKTEKEKNEEKEKFLRALEHDREYKERRLPKYMREKEEVIKAKLKPPTAGNSGNTSGGT